MMEGESFKKFLAGVSQFNQNLAAIVGGAQSSEKAAFGEPIDKFDRAVVLQLHSFGQDPNRWF